ncbi:MAG TPA: hypothetical protein VGN11_02020 [Candidatus Baltobacteraceae bacterium]|jgi:hypothetical protein|nr:hypothetical protein [Candidatus Baltobacteraceae bacterium]
MVGFSHVVLNLSLCSAIARAKPETTIALRMHMSDPHNRAPYDRSFTFERGYDSKRVVEFDAPRGAYHMELIAPKYHCGTSDYLMFISEHDRAIAETLSDGPPPTPPPMLMDGTAPASFLYAAPTFVIFDKSTACNAAVEDPLPSHFVVENDQDSYYVWLYTDPAIEARGSAIVALRLGTPTGEYHYVRVKIPYPIPWGGFPSIVTFNIGEDELDSLAGQPVDTLLCPKLFQTSAG